LIEIQEILGQRYCDPASMSTEQLRNSVTQDDEVSQYLVDGKFGHCDNDRGFFTIAWLSIDAILEKCDSDDVKTELQTYKDRIIAEVNAAVSFCDDA
jgi:hypothetical protein